VVQGSDKTATSQNDDCQNHTNLTYKNGDKQKNGNSQNSNRLESGRISYFSYRISSINSDALIIRTHKFFEK